MEFRTMSYFVAVAEELHFGRAAARVNIAQPAVSLQIKALEKDLGVQLLVRNTRRVQLTEAGTVFYKRCLGILHEMEVSRVLTQSVAGKEINKITIGTIYPATFGVLPIFLSKIGQRYPNIQIHIKSGTTNDIIRDLEQGKTNVGFIRPIENIGSLRYHNISYENYLLAISRKNPLAAAEKISIDDLREEKIISFSRSNLSYTERYFEERFNEHRLTSSIAYTCDDSLSLVSLVSAGIGVGFVPEWTQDLPSRNFFLRRVEGIDFKIALGIAWNQGDPTASRDDILEIARSLAAQQSSGRVRIAQH